MKVSEIYSESKAWIFEKPTSTTYDNYILPITRKVIAEIYEENNMRRISQGLLPLTSMPIVTSKEDDLTELGILEEYQREVVPKGIDANFMIDDDLTKMQIYNVEYNNARVSLQVMVSKDKVDSYTMKANKLAEEENAL